MRVAAAEGLSRLWDSAEFLIARIPRGRRRLRARANRFPAHVAYRTDVRGEAAHLPTARFGANPSQR